MSSLLTLVSVSGLVDIAVKSAAVMLLAVVVAALLGRASAAWRHLVWCLSVASLLLLPALALALPAWRVAWLPHWSAEPTQLAATGRTDLKQTNLQANHIEPIDAAPPTAIVAPTSAAAPGTAASSSLPATSETISPPLSPISWLAIAWTASGLLSLAPLSVGLWQLAALHRRSRVIGDRRWLALLNKLRRQLGVCRSVQLRQSAASLPPLTWGVLKPVLLLPAESSEWPEDRRRLVLLHELAHVRRWDWLTQLAAHFACALYWFNPLVWLAARQMRIERERACDDLVLASGAKASDYAQELVALAASLSRARVSTLVAVPMTRRGGLEDRLRGIFDRGRSRTALTTAAVCLGAAIVAAAIAPLAMLRAAPPEPPQSAAEQVEPAIPGQKGESVERRVSGEPPEQVGTAASGHKPPGLKPGNVATVNKPGDKAQPTDYPFVGMKARERVKQFRPAFGKAREGIEIGISLASDRKAFHEGERLPLELVIRNVSQKTLDVQHSFFAPETPPTVIGPAGKRFSIEDLLLAGTSWYYRNTLKPNEAVVYWHLGLGLGEKPNPPGKFWHPFLTNAVAGKYRLSQQLVVTVLEEGHDSGTAIQMATGEVEFDIEPADPTKANAAPAEKPVEKPAAKPLTIRGNVVDDTTGKPIATMIVQAGKFDPADPKKVLWGYKEDRSSAADGSFSTTICWDEGWTARILADRYFPQPVLAAAPPADKDKLQVTVRLVRVPERVRGVVLDHAGKPIKGAAVFAVPARGLNLWGGQAWSRAPDGFKDDSARPVLTDEQGRFELPTDDAISLAVSHAQFDAWPAAIPADGEITMRLPEPARVEINLDIAGANEESVIFYQLLSHLVPEFAVGDRGGSIGRVQSERWVPIANPGKLSLAALPPGHYQLCRQSALMLERKLFEIKAGEVKTFDFVRDKGARVRGRVTWPKDTELSSIVVSVLGGADNTVYATASPGGDGTFLTERIPPGTYQLQAYAYSPQTPERLRNTSPIPPSFQGQVKIEVPAEGELTAPDLALKPNRASE
jgi:beta-lactamase regulating signal transducer with metallopeptidase domain